MISSVLGKPHYVGGAGLAYTLTGTEMPRNWMPRSGAKKRVDSSAKHAEDLIRGAEEEVRAAQAAEATKTQPGPAKRVDPPPKRPLLFL